MSRETSIGEILRSCQRAFLFNISGNVRSISIKRNGKIIFFRAFFFALPTEEDREMITNAGGEVYGDFVDIDAWEVECLKSSEDDIHLDHLIFARAE